MPVLNRPERAAPLVASVTAESTRDWELLFLVSPGDNAEHAAVAELEDDRVSWRWALDEPGPGDYARKINLGYQETDSPWIFQAADDLRFHPGWDELAIATGDRYGVGVVGTNDLCNPRVVRGNHSTHSMIRRAYIDECGGSDRPGIVLNEEYAHNFVDDELVGVARSRGCFVMSPAIVEHLHPTCRKGSYDGTYEAGHATFHADRARFQARRRYWERRPVARR